VQGLREEVYSETMIDDWKLGEIFHHQDSPLWNIGRIMDLRILLKSLQEELNEMEKDPMKNEGLILKEKSILEATHKEIRRLERENFNSEFGLD
jgi:hypothetical protein